MAMNIAIMQPYFFPYIGYFQLMAAVDVFVVYDDVTYIKGGWIARNNMWSPVGAQRFGIQLNGRSSFLKICDISVIPVFSKLRKTIEQTYRKAPYFDQVMPVVDSMLRHPDLSLGNFLTYSLGALRDHLGLTTQLVQSSSFDSSQALRSQDRVIAICKQLHADHYINLPGGKTLYHANEFAQSGLALSFIHSRPVRYPQFGSTFIPNLSMLDVLMFNSIPACQTLLREYDLDFSTQLETTTKQSTHG